MLKPKKTITKKEIQRDPFLESINKAQVHLQEKRSNYMKIALGLIVVLIGYNIISEKKSQSNFDASAALGQAMVALDRGDLENTQFQLETVISEFSGSKSAKIAGYHLGKIKYESGDKIGAEIYLSQYLRDQPVDVMVSSTALMLADISLQVGNAKEAISFLDIGIKKSKDSHTLRMIKLEKAKIILSQGDIDRARTITDGILSDKDVTVIEKQVAEEILGRIPG
jgi:predicted negative regulator of RcsB-dependent stress response